MYNEFKLVQRYDYEKKEESNLLKKYHNLKNTVRNILLFFHKMPDKKPEDPTYILAWKVSLQFFYKKAINILLMISIEISIINNKMELTMNFVRDKIV